MYFGQIRTNVTSLPQSTSRLTILLRYVGERLAMLDIRVAGMGSPSGGVCVVELQLDVKIVRPANISLIAWTTFGSMVVFVAVSVGHVDMGLKCSS